MCSQTLCAARSASTPAKVSYSSMILAAQFEIRPPPYHAILLRNSLVGEVSHIFLLVLYWGIILRPQPPQTRQKSAAKLSSCPCFEAFVARILSRVLFIFFALYVVGGGHSRVSDLWVSNKHRKTYPVTRRCSSTLSLLETSKPRGDQKTDHEIQCVTKFLFCLEHAGVKASNEF